MTRADTTSVRTFPHSKSFVARFSLARSMNERSIIDHAFKSRYNHKSWHALLSRWPVRSANLSSLEIACRITEMRPSRWEASSPEITPPTLSPTDPGRVPHNRATGAVDRSVCSQTWSARSSTFCRRRHQLCRGFRKDRTQLKLRVSSSTRPTHIRSLRHGSGGPLPCRQDRLANQPLYFLGGVERHQWSG